MNPLQPPVCKTVKRELPRGPADFASMWNLTLNAKKNPVPKGLRTALRRAVGPGLGLLPRPNATGTDNTMPEPNTFLKGNSSLRMTR